MTDRRLALRSDTLAELRTDELAAVVGGDGEATSPLTACVVEVTSRLVECDSLLRPCISSTCGQ